MKYKLSNRIAQVSDPPVERMNQVIRERIQVGLPIYNFGQAIADFCPPAEVMEQFSRWIRKDPHVHLYTSDAGMEELRTAIAADMTSEFRISAASKVEPDEILISAGANHAATIVGLTFLEDGAKVGVFSPYFLNHTMLIEGLGGQVVPLLPDGKGVYDIEAIRRTIEREQLRFLLLVNPANPTGKCFAPSFLQRLVEICIHYEIVLVVDEVYERFLYKTDATVPIHTIPGALEATVTIRSFSKSFGMTGWRVGYIRAPKSLLSMMLKAQDFTQICAARPSQKLALELLTHHRNYPETFLPSLFQRRELALCLLKNSECFDVCVEDGAFFLWCRPRNYKHSNYPSMELLKQTGVCVIAGSAFGKEWSDWFRLSFGNASLKTLEAGIQRLIQFHEGVFYEQAGD